MLCLGLNQGEYITVGSDVVIQLDRIVGDRCRLMIEAPREIPVVRGRVLEREGGERPDCVFDTPRYHKREIPWDRSKAQALSAMRALLNRMDGRDSSVQTLRRQLNHIFPPAQMEEASGGPEGRTEPKPGEVSNG